MGGFETAPIWCIVGHLVLARQLKPDKRWVVMPEASKGERARSGRPGAPGTRAAIGRRYSGPDVVYRSRR